MKSFGQECSNHKLARLLEAVKRDDEDTPLVEDSSYNFKLVATAPSCSEDVEAEADVGTMVVGHKKDDNIIEEAADGMDWRVC